MAYFTESNKPTNFYELQVIIPLITTEELYEEIEQYAVSIARSEFCSDPVEQATQWLSDCPYIKSLENKLILSEDMALKLFTSAEPFPLHDFLVAWKGGEVKADVGYIIAVVNAYKRISQNHDGPRDGTYRPKTPTQVKG